RKRLMIAFIFFPRAFIYVLWPFIRSTASHIWPVCPTSPAALAATMTGCFLFIGRPEGHSSTFDAS
ncbi:hypothetical protein, partial [Burkholderia multivorans]|uniref:hypothetical protein n=1 Tax=Burkholderia multivorans TaxID=87883 RepID=UPI0021C21CFB